MPAAAVATIVISLVLVAALAYYLVRVVLILRRVVETLGKIESGVRTIAQRAEPIDPTLVGVNDDLGSVAQALEGLVPESDPAESR